MATKNIEEKIESVCDFLVNAIQSPKVLMGVIIFQSIWMAFGIITKIDPPPFLILLTASNVIQLILIFVLGVGQRKTNKAHEEHKEVVKEHNATTKKAVAKTHKKIQNIEGQLDQILNHIQKTRKR